MAIQWVPQIQYIKESKAKLAGPVNLACRLKAAHDPVMMMVMLMMMMIMMIMMTMRVLQCSERGALAAGRNAPGCFH